MSCEYWASESLNMFSEPRIKCTCWILYSIKRQWERERKIEAQIVCNENHYWMLPFKCSTASVHPYMFYCIYRYNRSAYVDYYVFMVRSAKIYNIAFYLYKNCKIIIIIIDSSIWRVYCVDALLNWSIFSNHFELLPPVR